MTTTIFSESGFHDCQSLQDGQHQAAGKVPLWTQTAPLSEEYGRFEKYVDEQSDHDRASSRGRLMAETRETTVLDYVTPLYTRREQGRQGET